MEQKKQEKKELTEEQILEFWAKNKIYEKSKSQNKKGKKFYLMDGPPYATGNIHIGTALNKILKDIAMRSHRLQGCDVFDRAGYDTHGVPIEFKIEKEIGSRSKQDIEKYGVKRFVEKCKEFATRYIDVMNSEFKNLGVWMNFENPYLTLSDDYMETIWDTFKIADKKKLLYLGKYPVHVCPRCATAVAYNEIEYAKQEDNSIFVKFPLKNKKNSFLIIWTTTPWTLPANTAVMVNPGVDYQEIELSSGEKWVIAKELVPKIMAELGLGYTAKREFTGKEMEGWAYENPLAKNLKLNLKNAYKVILSARYVTTEDGTGLVHCAPGHGKEDYEVGKEYKIDMPSPVDIYGNLTEEAGKYAGKKARVVDEEIISDLEKDNALVYKLKYSHDYPLCWRCKSPLLMISQPQWFLKISDIQKRILEENENTNWNPAWMKLRMKAWLEGISDWPVSRKRYWGTPLPIWICDKCDKRIVIGSIDELRKLANIPKTKKINLHKPGIDEIIFDCSCKGKMRRIPDVLDVWFDAGVSSWAALGEDVKKYWPADINIEGKDQVRGWWNSQLILSEIKFDKKPFENIMVHGMILSLGKVKMSKSLGNIVSPQEIIKKYNRDYLRYYFAKVSKGEDFDFDEREFSEIQKVFRVFLNVNNFVNQIEKGKQKIEIEDKWILSKFNLVMGKTIYEDYNNFKFPEAIQDIEDFLMNDLSRTYIQIIRDRSDECYEILNRIRIGLILLLAPIIPFTTEKIWQDLRQRKIVKEESVHLSHFLNINGHEIDKRLELEFDIVLEVIEKGLAERDKLKIGLKWPLAKATIYSKEQQQWHQPLIDLQEIIKSQLNVKKIELKVDSKGEIKVELDTKITPELEAEGYARELARNIQAERKNAGFVKSDFINLEIISDLNGILGSQKQFIQERVNAKNISFNDSGRRYDYSRKGKIKEKNFEIKFSKI